jgi:hypothetical protein
MHATDIYLVNHFVYYNVVTLHTDKSWMTKWRGSREYMGGAESL